jgi:hypothetical protein
MSPATRRARLGASNPEGPPPTAGGRQDWSDAPEPVRSHTWDRRHDHPIPGVRVGGTAGARNGLPVSVGYDPGRAGPLDLPPGPPGDCDLPPGPPGDCDGLAALGQWRLCECGYPPGSPSCLAVAPHDRAAQ